MSKFNDERVHFRNKRMKGLGKQQIPSRLHIYYLCGNSTNESLDPIECLQRTKKDCKFGLSALTGLLLFPSKCLELPVTDFLLHSDVSLLSYINDLRTSSPENKTSQIVVVIHMK